MSQCVVPNWVVRHDQLRQEPDEQGKEGKRFTHVHMNGRDPRPHPQPTAPKIPIMNRGLAELAWENGNLTILHGLGELPQCGPAKQAWIPRAGDTLESVVHQATTGIKRNSPSNTLSPANVDSSVVASSAAKWPENSYDGGRAQRRPDSVEKLENQKWVTRKKQCSREDVLDFEFTNTSITENDTTTTTWLSFESPNSLKTKTTEDDSTSHGGTGNPDHEEVEKKRETRRTHSSRRNRAAAIHNQSERKRRDRINQKMKALQKLVPNSSKTDKASILDEVIEYLKQLQAQLQLMSTARSMPHLMMPLGMQQLQMSLMARMAGMGLGLGMGMATATHPPAMPSIFHPTTSQPSPAAFVPPFLLPSLLPTHTAPLPAKTDAGTTPGPISSPDPYSAFVAQSMNNIDLFNKMTTLFRQQMGLPASANIPQSHAKESGT